MQALRHLTLPRVDIATSADLGTATSSVALTGQDTGQVVLVHEVTLTALSALFFRIGANELLLVFGENELIAPSSLATASLPLTVGGSVGRLGHTVNIAAGVPLHVFLQVHGECAVGGGCAGNTGEGVLAATGAELLVHFLGGQEAGVAALDEGSQVLDLLESRGGQKVEVHLQENVLTLIQLVRKQIMFRLRDILTAKSVVMVATCMVLGAAVRVADPDSS